MFAQSNLGVQWVLARPQRVISEALYFGIAGFTEIKEAVPSFIE